MAEHKESRRNAAIGVVVAFGAMIVAMNAVAVAITVSPVIRESTALGGLTVVAALSASAAAGFAAWHWLTR